VLGAVRALSVRREPEDGSRELRDCFHEPRRLSPDGARIT
jgi:hypothetical protein